MKRTPPSTIPTERDWADTGRDDGLELDREYAKERFAGRSHEQAVELFFNTVVLERIDNLRWMPPVPFRFYLRAFLAYLRSERLRVDPAQRPWRSDAASAFLTLLAEKLERRPQDVRPLLDEVLPVVDFIAARQSEFDADERIYGSFPERAAKIHELVAGGSGGHNF